jgi:26S proteasome regulatory subunit N2
VAPQKTKDIYDKLRNILGGQESVKLYLEFLKRNNKVDLLILKNTKVSILILYPK